MEGLVPDCSIPGALAMEKLQPCTKPSIYLFCLGNIKSPYRQLLSGVPDYFGRNKISSGGDLSHYSSASLY